MRISQSSSAAPAPQPPTLGDNLRSWFRLGRRQWLPVATCGMIGLFAGTYQQQSKVPLYTAKTTLILDTRKVRAVRDNSAFGDEAGNFDQHIYTQLEMLRSEKLAALVHDKLQPLLAFDNGLSSEPARAATGTLLGALARARAGLQDFGVDQAHASILPSTDFRKQRIGSLLGGLNYRRVGRGQLVEILFTGYDPVMTAAIANEFAETLLTEQSMRYRQATTRASDWLGAQLVDLKIAMEQADLAVHKYKIDQKLVLSGGQPVDEQRLINAFSQLTAMRGDVERLEARHAKIKQMAASGRMEVTVAELPGASQIEPARAAYLAASTAAAELKKRVGADHEAAQNAASSLRDAEARLKSELRRLVDISTNEIEIAKSREATLSRHYQLLVGESGTTGEALVRLRELERNSEIQRSLYSAMLLRRHEALQQQAFPNEDIRIFEKAQPPSQPDRAASLRYLLGSMFAGLMAGLGIAAMRETLDGTLRTKRQADAALGLPSAHYLPMLGGGGPLSGSRTARSQPQVKFLRHVLDKPGTAFANRLLAIKAMADVAIPGPSRVVGVVSALPSEGTTTVAKNLATLIAQQGHRTLLVDGNGRNPALSNWLVDTVPAGSHLAHESESGLDILCGADGVELATTLAAGGAGSREAVTNCPYDYVIIDLPALAEATDAGAFTRHVDGYLLVIEWGKTKTEAVQALLADHPHVRAGCLGVALTKVDIDKLSTFEPVWTAYRKA